MTWPDGREGRVLAAVYLIAWTGLVLAIAWTLYDQITGHDVAPVAAAAFIIGVVALFALSLRLRRAVPEPPRRGGTAPTPFQRTWYRLSLGLELRTAFRALTR